MAINKFRKIHIPVIIGLLLLLTGCITSKKMNKYVSDQYGESVSLKKVKNDYLSISSPLITTDEIPSNSTKKTKKVLPLLFFWRIDYQTSCILNPKIPINLFNSTLITYANSKGLKQKLNGGNLELSIDKIPNTFSFNDDFSLIWLILFKISWEKIYLLPENREMAMSYRITKDGTEIKKGSVVIPDPNKIKQTRYFQSVRSATREYLVQYDENIKAMARAVVDNLIAEF